MAALPPNPFISSIEEPLGFFIYSYTKTSYLSLRTIIINSFYKEHEFDPSLKWHVNENKFSFVEFSDDGIVLNHEIPFTDLLVERLDFETENSIKLLNDNYEEIFIANGNEQAENYIELQQTKILSCHNELKSFTNKQLNIILTKPLNKIVEFLSSKTSSLPSSIVITQDSKNLNYFKWKVESSALVLALSEEFYKLLISKGLIDKHSRKKIISAFSGQLITKSLNIPWMAVNPRNNSSPSFSSLFYLIDYLKYKDLIQGDFPLNRDTSNILNNIFCRADGYSIGLTSLKHAKSEYKKESIDLSSDTTNPNFKKIRSIVDQLVVFKNQQNPPQ